MRGTGTAFLRAVESNGAIVHPNKINLLGVLSVIKVKIKGEGTLRQLWDPNRWSHASERFL